MSYKQHMHPAVSKGEIELFKALSKANLTGGVVTQDPVVLKFTLSDFCWREKKKAVYTLTVSRYTTKLMWKRGTKK